MKKTLAIIITFFAFFSISNAQVKNNWLIDQLMDFPFWVEEFKLKVNDLEYVHFYDQDSQNLYNNFRFSDEVLKDELMRQYREWNIEYYRMNWIINDYNLYVYHANKMFSYISQKEFRYDSQLDSIILNHYTLARTHYDRAKHLIATRPEKKIEKDDYPYWWLSNNWQTYPYSFYETIPDRWARY